MLPGVGLGLMAAKEHGIVPHVTAKPS